MSVKRKVAYMVLTFILITFVQHVAAHNDYSISFSKGVNAYENRQYDDALAHFTQLANDGIVSAEIYFNIGNTYFRLNQIGEAILSYKRGLRLQPNNRLLKSNLNYLLSLTKDRQQIGDENPFLRLLGTGVNFFSLNGLILFTLFFFLVSVLIIDMIIINYRGEDKTIPYFLLSISMIIMIVFGSTALYRHKSLYDEKEAVLVASSATGYSGPAEDYTNLFRIHEGMIFDVVKTDKEWSQIVLPTGISGWIKNELFESVRRGW